MRHQARDRDGQAARGDRKNNDKELVGVGIESHAERRHAVDAVVGQYSYQDDFVQESEYLDDDHADRQYGGAFDKGRGYVLIKVFYRVISFSQIKPPIQR